jgi:hypothetical protein
VDARSLWVLQIEVQQQCSFVQRAGRDLDAALAREDTELVWYSLQALLVSAANLSKLFWGAPLNPSETAAVEAERAPLRRSLRVTKRSPLRSRRVRNAFEHVDAKLASHTGPLVSRNVGPSRIWRLPGVKRYGHFDPETGLVTFWSESVNIRRITAEVERIAPLVQAAVGKPL